MANDSPYSIGAGEGIDRDDVGKIDIRHNSSPRKRGYIFSFTVSAGMFGERTAYLYFPKIKHSVRKGDTDDGYRYTYADLAEIFMKGGGGSKHVSAGKWKTWTSGNVNSLLEENVGTIKNRINLLVDSEVKKAKKEWASIMRGKKAQQKIKPIRDAIKKMVADRKEHLEESRREMPDFERIIGWGSIKKIDLISASKAKFINTKNMHILEARALRQLIASKRAELEQLKRDTYKATRSSTISQEIEDLMEMSLVLDESVNNQEGFKVKEKLDALTMPFGVASTLKKIVQNVADEIREEFYELIKGAKQPPLSRKTIYNRRWRGNGSTDPLYETGELAESLTTEVK